MTPNEFCVVYLAWISKQFRWRRIGQGNGVFLSMQTNLSAPNFNESFYKTFKRKQSYSYHAVFCDIIHQQRNLRQTQWTTNGYKLHYLNKIFLPQEEYEWLISRGKNGAEYLTSTYNFSCCVLWVRLTTSVLTKKRLLSGERFYRLTFWTGL